ncbi:MAG: (2Fe-2S)-binding protein [Paludibacteraceae bacterium]
MTAADEVGEETTAGTTCGSCISDIEDILQEING